MRAVFSTSALICVVVVLFCRNHKQCSYDGEWENDTRTGYGLYVWEEGDIYSGGWLNGLRQYYGRYEWPGARCCPRVC